MSAKRIAYNALFTAAALVLHVVESALPPLLPFAIGAKLGLANVVSLIALFILGTPDAYIILAVRCLLGALFGGNLWGLAYSLPAGLVSLTCMALLSKLLIPRISLVTVSFIGAIMHNAVQLLVASLTVRTNLISLLPAYLLASLLAGLFVGYTAYFAIKYLPPKFYLIKKSIHSTEEPNEAQHKNERS